MEAFCYALRVNVGEARSNRLRAEPHYFYKKYGMLVLQAAEADDIVVLLNLQHRPGQTMEELLPAAVFKSMKNLGRIDRSFRQLAPTVLEATGAELGPIPTEPYRPNRPYDWAVDDWSGLGQPIQKQDLTQELLRREMAAE